MFTKQMFLSFVRVWSPFAIACALLLGAGSASAQGAPIKIGFVDIERILRDAKPAKEATRKLESEFNARDKELQAMARRLKETGEKYERDSAVMSERDRRRAQREFADEEKDFQRRQREFREDLSQRRNEELSQVIEKANRAIKRIAETEKYDIIVQEAVVTSKRIDITDKIIQALDK